MRGRSSPEIVFSVVVLPAPLLPSRATISPCATRERDPLEGVDLPVVDVEIFDLKHGRSPALAPQRFRPRYASMTRGSFWTAAGSPSAIFSP